MKVLIAENISRYNAAIAVLNEKAACLQDALTAYTALGIPTVPTTADLPDLWLKPKVFLERMLTGGQLVTFNGGVLELEPGKVFDMLKKPDGTPAFFATLETLHERGFQNVGNQSIEPARFEINGNTVQVKAGEQAFILEGYRIYATTQRQKDEWDALQVITTKLEFIRQNGRFGSVFQAAEYLGHALVNQGRFDGQNPVQADANYMLHSLARLQ